MLEIYYHPLYSTGISESSNFPRERYKLLYQALSVPQYAEDIKFITPEKVKIDLLYQVHQKTYVDNFLNGNLSKTEQRKIGLRPWTSDIVERTLLITGGSIQALDSAINNGISGNLAGGTHHAHYSHGAGYCIFNDIAVCAFYCKNNYKNFQNILIIDLDVHQGDGTASLLKKENSVFTFSIHCESNFPLKKENSDIDISLKKGTNDTDYLSVLYSNLKSLEKIEADIVFFQAGVDSLEEDKLGHMKMTNDGMKKRNKMILDFSKKKSCPVLVFMGGGYSEPIDHTIEAFRTLFIQCSQYI